MLCLDSFFFCVCVSIVDFRFAATMKFWYSSLYIQKIVLSCWSFNFKCIFSILHLCSPPLTIAGFDIIFVWKWFPTFTVCLPLLKRFYICNFLDSSCGLFCLEKFLWHLLQSWSGSAEFSWLLLVCKTFDFSIKSEWKPCWVAYSWL